MSTSKIDIKVGIVEFSGEGDEKWLAEQFDKMLAKVPELLKIEVSSSSSTNQKSKNENSSASNVKAFDLSMTNVAAKINEKTGAGLATAAAAYLRLVQQKNSFSRDEILNAMKEATGYFQKSYVNNLSKILQQLVKNNTFKQNSDSRYSLQIDKETQLNDVLSK